MRPALALCIATVLLASPAGADELKPVRTITVTGQAERKVVPDEAHVMVNISALNTKLAEAKTEHDQKLRTVMEIAKDASIDEAQIKTQSSNVQPQYTYENNKNNFKGYRVATTLDITVKQPDAVGGFTEKLMAAGLESKTDNAWTGLLSINYTLSNPDKIRDDMAADAIENAHTKAETMATAAGATLGDVYQITEGNAPMFNPRPMPMMAMARASNGAMDKANIAPPAGEETVNASVTITYELKN